MNIEDTFYVWRRCDGHVGASNGRMPRDYVSAADTEWTFDLLLKTSDWPTARDLIQREREKNQ
jgi:hypothetical protein